MKQRVMGRMELPLSGGDSVYVQLAKDEAAHCYNLTATYSEGSKWADKIYTYGSSEEERAVNNYLAMVKHFTKAGK